MPTAAGMSTPKSAQKSKLVKLRLESEKLSRFPSSLPSTPVKQDSLPSTQPQAQVDKREDLDATPIPPNTDGADPNTLAPPKADDKKKRGGNGASGKKRAPPSIDPNGPMRERGRPGPKKKPRLPDGTIDRSAEPGATPKPGATTIPAHKLGPKANTGAINAGLRALDRSGKPCRRWQKNGVKIKSFTGNLWGVDSWKAPKRDDSFSGDVKSDSTGSSELKPQASSAVGSERSHSNVDGGDTIMTNGLESSPAPAVAT
nr:ino80 complex subunit 4 [Quercus suber]